MQDHIHEHKSDSLNGLSGAILWYPEWKSVAAFDSVAQMLPSHAIERMSLYVTKHLH